MDAVNLHTMVNLTGGAGEDLAYAITNFDRAFPRRFVSMTEPTWTRAGEVSLRGLAGGRNRQGEDGRGRGPEDSQDARAVPSRRRSSELVRVDDPRFDPMWETCGRLIWPWPFMSGTRRFFLPIDRFNERCEELNAHPDWSFYGKDFPAFKEILDARDRIAPGTKTTFVALHVGHWAENLAAVGEMLDKFRNVNVEIGARIGELGRQPRTAAQFFDKYQDRVLFGTDAIPLGTETPQQVFGEICIESITVSWKQKTSKLDYAPAKPPPQGRWRIYGLGLREPILRKVNHENAQRVLGLKLIGA